MDIRSIRYFMEAARELNITRAAENLHIAQPPLSRQIHQLEEELGVELFERKKKKLQLTEVGQLLLHRGDQIVTLVEKTEDEIRAFGKGVTGTLYLGTVEGSAPKMISRWVAEFSCRYPEVQYNLWNGSSDDVISRLSKGLCDLAVIAAPYDTERWEGIPVGSEPWAALIPHDHPLAKAPGDFVSLSDLAGEPLIIPSRKSRAKEIRGWFEKIKEEPKILCEISNYMNAFALVKAKVGIAIFPATMDFVMTHTQVVTKTIVNPGHQADYVLVWDKNRSLEGLAEKFLGCVQDLQEKEYHGEEQKKEKRMIKLVASDVDGTLLPEGSSDMNPELYDVIRRLKEKGIVFAAASGRQMNSVRRVFRPVLDDVYFISNNGGYVKYRQNVLACRAFAPEMAEEIITYIRTMKDTFSLVTAPDGDYTDSKDPEILRWLREGYRLSIEEVEDILEKKDRLVKISAFVKNQDAAQAAQPAIEKFAGRALVTAAGEHWIDFTALGSEKGNALKELQERLGVTAEETMAFGDNNNDISMLKCAGESYAVAEAREEVKAVSKYVLPAEADSVLHVLKTLL